MIRHELIRAMEEFLKQKFEHATEFEQPGIAYRIEHTYRVANIGREIAVREGRFWPAWKDHGRRSARIARPFPEELGLPKDRIDDICYGIAIHVDEKADFPGENTPFALSVGDADGIDRFDAYRLHENLSKDAFLKKRLRKNRSTLKSGLPGCGN